MVRNRDYGLASWSAFGLGVAWDSWWVRGPELSTSWPRLGVGEMDTGLGQLAYDGLGGGAPVEPVGGRKTG